MDAPPFLDEIAARHGCAAQLARQLITDCLAALHEASYKRGTAAGVEAAHAELGGLAAWHLMGLVVDAADTGDPGTPGARVHARGTQSRAVRCDRPGVGRGLGPARCAHR